MLNHSVRSYALVSVYCGDHVLTPLFYISYGISLWGSTYQTHLFYLFIYFKTTLKALRWRVLHRVYI